MEIIKKYITKNYTKGRKSPINRITIHTAVSSASSLYGWFNNPKAYASSHYYVNKDGKIEQYVKETDQAWSNSNRTANGRAITIETWDGLNPNDSKRTNKLYASVAWLVANIAKRYNIPLSVVGKNSAYNWNKAGIDKHWYYANKSCPAGLDINRIIREAKEVNSNIEIQMTDEQIKRFGEVRTDLKKAGIDTVEKLKEHIQKQILSDYLTEHDWRLKTEKQRDEYASDLERAIEDTERQAEQLQICNKTIEEYSTIAEDYKRKFEASEALKKEIEQKWQKCEKKQSTVEPGKPDFVGWIIKLFSKD